MLHHASYINRVIKSSEINYDIINTSVRIIFKSGQKLLCTIEVKE